MTATRPDTARGPAPADAPDAAAIAALQARGRFGIRLGLGRTRALLAALGSPETALRGALIGGTNGKGSTQAMVSSALREMGLRVGQTPKPHLVSYRERIVVDGQPITATDLAALVDEVLPAADRVVRRHGDPTEFELLTAAAFLWFARTRVDVAVIEVGLGGRLDATNVWDGGVAAIVNVQRDHMEHLGDTIGAIAREKAAIIKRGDRAVTGADGEALRVIRRRAARLDVPLDVRPPLEVLGMDVAGLRLVDPALGEIALGLLGRHQAANSSVAIGVLQGLALAGIAPFDAPRIRAGLAAARWPGRLELLRVARTPGLPIDVLLDGAHNVAGATALADAVDELAPSLGPGQVTLLLGLMRDKEVAQMLAALRGSARLAEARVIAVSVPDAPRALPADELATAWGPAALAHDPFPDALGAALASAVAQGGPLIVAGSLYLVGAVRGALLPSAGGAA